MCNYEIKYYTAESVKELTTELEKAKDTFSFLISCKNSNQPFGEHLNTLLEDEITKLADVCEQFNELFNDYLTDPNNELYNYYLTKRERKNKDYE
jgi:hypothetical protein